MLSIALLKREKKLFPLSLNTLFLLRACFKCNKFKALSLSILLNSVSPPLLLSYESKASLILGIK